MKLNQVGVQARAFQADRQIAVGGSMCKIFEKPQEGNMAETVNGEQKAVASENNRGLNHQGLVEE